MAKLENTSALDLARIILEEMPKAMGPEGGVGPVHDLSHVMVDGHVNFVRLADLLLDRLH